MGVKYIFSYFYSILLHNTPPNIDKPITSYITLINAINLTLSFAPSCIITNIIPAITNLNK